MVALTHRRLRTLAACLALALLGCHDDAISNDCRRDYESEYWHNVVWYVGDDSRSSHLRPPDLHCVDI
jgi:hypothetical protein